ncbi:MAG: hypothetical protein ACYCOU_03115 [Sulfobacillus sp.]
MKFIKLCIYATFFKLVEKRKPCGQRTVYFTFPNFRLCIYYASSPEGELITNPDIETILRTVFVIAIQRELGQVFFDVPGAKVLFTIRDSSNKIKVDGDLLADTDSIQQTVARGKPIEIIKEFRRILSKHTFPDRGYPYIQTAFDAVIRDPAFETAPFDVDGAE